jgi:hypothetical protein
MLLSHEHEQFCRIMASGDSKHTQYLKERFRSFGFCYQDDALPINPLIFDATAARRAEEDIRHLIDVAREIAMQDFEGINNLRSDQRPIVLECLKQTEFAPVIARPDAVLVNGELKILELNIDSGVGGVQEISEIQAHIKTSQAASALEIHDPIQGQIELIRKTALSVVKHDGPPRVSIVIYKHFPEYFVNQSKILAARISEGGEVLANVNFPEELSVSEFVTDGETEYDLIYRDGSAQYEEEKFSEMGRLLLCAVRSKTVILADPRDMAVEDKGTLAVLSEKADDGTLPDRICKLVHKYVPWTRSVAAIARRETCAVEYLTHGKDGLVLKRKFSDKGRHVVVGLAKNEAEWADAVAEALSQPTGWVVQKYLKPDAVLFAFEYEGKIRQEYREITVGPYVFGTNAQSWLVRIQRGENTRVLARLLSGGYGMTGVAYK